MHSSDSVVLITVDCLRANHVGCYGYDRPTTPHIDRFAGRATRYKHSYANSPGTRWALQTIHTGVHTGQIDGLGVPSEGISLAETFRDAGYATGGFAKNGFLTRDYHYDRGFETFIGESDFEDEHHPIKRVGKRLYDRVGSATIRERVLQPINDWLLSTQGETAGYRPAITDEELCARAIGWIVDQQSAGQPFFAWIHLMDAHTPYARWNDHLAALRGDTDVRHVIDPTNEVAEGRDPPQAVIEAYDAGVRSADEQIGRVLDALDVETAVAITGDHGEEFGRYGPFHTASLVSSMTQVPLLVRVPGVENGRVADYPAQHLDIAPTLADAAGIAAPSAWRGVSLLTADRESDEPLYFAVSDERGVRAGEWKLIRRAADELYRTPHHGDDGAGVGDEYPNKRDDLATLLCEHEEWVAENQAGSGEQNIGNSAAGLSESTRQSLENLGYLE
jgi:arylsulfatase A-like enzyme